MKRTNYSSVVATCVLTVYSIEVSINNLMYCALCNLKQLACDQMGTSDWLMVM